ncbi:tyrosine-protein phosphatase [Nocardia goodfellowii]|uniref:Protein-tyrosine phosphatase n=1 Tax=Nocardia goodfellowii TaxID=882446 RepID=A0ABS4QLW2_9NOCA|nr:tyrosine-protein phosphatase [Nocardia goodfellowii]MBP2192681.1 protein-tyrosine phosphatase [Nocardia goodfellowii]
MTFSRALRGTVAASAALFIGVLPLDVPAALADSAAVPVLRAPGQADRPMGLAHAPNARDIGGYPVTGGGKLTFGQVFRADALDAIDAAEQARLEALKITVAIDFRSPAEVAAAPDKLPASIARIELPVYDPANDFFIMISQLIGAGPEKQQQALGNGKAAEIMRTYYRWFVTDPSARGQFAAALRGVATTPGPILYHCTAGKDRTGVLTGIIMAALGVAKGQIYKDFLESNDTLAAENEALLSALEARGLIKDRSLLVPIVGVQRDYLEAFFDQVDQTYGSFDTFLGAGLGIDAATLEALKTKLVR